MAPDSDIETYAAVQVHIDSWRWAGVPILMRTGKSLPNTVTEVIVRLKPTPQRIFSGIDFAPTEPNYVRFRLGPEVEIAIGTQVLQPGTRGEDMQARATELIAARDRPRTVGPYHRLLTEAMRGETLLFAREDEVEEAWSIVDPLTEQPPGLESYEPGSWGPPGAERLASAVGGWHAPSAEPRVD